MDHLPRMFQGNPPGPRDMIENEEKIQPSIVSFLANNFFYLGLSTTSKKVLVKKYYSLNADF